ncbi:MAG: hypothetical protein KF764_17450 [Labilithrix sp.]|nr:hypothetical protein [Labilithrix sp.]
MVCCAPMSPLRSLRQKHLQRWLPGYLRDVRERAFAPAWEGPRHVLFAICDHYEPLWGQADDAKGAARVAMWRRGYPELAARYRDADGRPPRHSFFFPGEQYRPEYLEPLAELARAGFGEVEVHLHHDGDTAASLEAQLSQALSDFARHGHISRDADGRHRYAFIHGNWALANARGDGRWCGVDAELPLLFRTGCYADFTFPAGPDECQPNVVNRIYWPTGDLDAKRSYETGTRARVGEVMRDRLLLVQGPLGIARRGLGVRIEYSALTAHDPATPARARSWLAPAIHVEGRPDWLFVKLHTHGAPDKQGASLLGEGGHALHQILTSRYNDGREWILHYVTAREMYNVAIAAMEGARGNPYDFRDHVIKPPPVAVS